MKANTTNVVVTPNGTKVLNIHGPFETVTVEERYDGNELVTAVVDNGEHTVSFRFDREFPWNPALATVWVEHEDVLMYRTKVCTLDIVDVCVCALAGTDYHHRRAVARLLLRWLGDANALYDGEHTRNDERRIRYAGYMRTR